MNATENLVCPDVPKTSRYIGSSDGQSSSVRPKRTRATDHRGFGESRCRFGTSHCSDGDLEAASLRPDSESSGAVSKIQTAGDAADIIPGLVVRRDPPVPANRLLAGVVTGQGQPDVATEMIQ